MSEQEEQPYRTVDNDACFHLLNHGPWSLVPTEQLNQRRNNAYTNHYNTVTHQACCKQRDCVQKPWSSEPRPFSHGDFLLFIKLGQVVKCWVSNNKYQTRCCCCPGICDGQSTGEPAPPLLRVPQEQGGAAAPGILANSSSP